MSQATTSTDKLFQEKMNDCLENLREMKEMEIELQQSSPEVGSKVKSTSWAYVIDLWLEEWKIARETNLEYYCCLDGMLVDELYVLKVPSPEDVTLSQLQAFHEKHLLEKLSDFERYLCRIREKHRYLANQLVIANTDPVQPQVTSGPVTAQAQQPSNAYVAASLSS